MAGSNSDATGLADDELRMRLYELLHDREPLFEWVSKHGFFGPGPRVFVGNIDLNRIPEFAQVALIGAIYVTLIAASVLVRTPLRPPSAARGFWTTRGHLLASYGAFILLFAMVVYVGYVHYRRVRAEIG